MKDNFDFNRIGKRMPYTGPEDFLEDIENNVWKTIRNDNVLSRPKKDYRLWLSISGGLIAASVAFLLVFNYMPIDYPTDDFEKLEQAFSRLSSTDQNYLITVYQNDLFLNE